MTNEPTDYSDFDFGFTAVDADELESGQEIVEHHTTEVVNEISSELVDKIDGLEGKLNAVLLTLESDSSTDFSLPNDDLSRIESKIDQIVSLETDELAEMFSNQGNDIRAIIDEVEERKGQLEEEYKVKMDDIEKLIMPLLYNLLKNPEKEYILWPNRTEVIQKQINKIIAVTRT
jgi:ABC-type transporter Mla subunit MlaD